MKRKYKSSEDWKMFGFEPIITEVTGKPEAAMKSAQNGHWLPIHILQDLAETERDRDIAEKKLAELNEKTKAKEENNHVENI